MFAATRAEVSLRGRSVLRQGLLIETRSGIVRLMLVKFLRRSFARRRLRQSPAREVLLLRSVGRELGCVSARSD